MKIKRINENKEKYMNLLLEADPDENVIKSYINKGDMYVGIEDEKAVCAIVIIEVNSDECELKNIATLKEYRGKGYAKKLIKYVFKEYSMKYKRMIVGTSENMIPFYVLNGFTKYHHTVKNFFVDNYNEEIWDGDLHCIDMYYYAKEFRRLDYSIVEINKEIRKQVNNILINEWEATDIIIRGKVIDGTKLDGFVAIDNNKIIGLITFIIEKEECEICSLNSFIENKGIGTNLINKVKEYAKQKNCTRLKLITTNDNIRGLEFYQRRGFMFSNIYKNAIENSRKIKPQIPIFADNGLPIRDEIELEMII